MECIPTNERSHICCILSLDFFAVAHLDGRDPRHFTFAAELLKMYQTDYLNLEFYWSIIVFLAVTMEDGCTVPVLK